MRWGAGKNQRVMNGIHEVGSSILLGSTKDRRPLDAVFQRAFDLSLEVFTALVLPFYCHSRRAWTRSIISAASSSFPGIKWAYVFNVNASSV